MREAPYNDHPPFVADSDTSRQAADSVASTASNMRHEVYASIKAKGAKGMTCWEVEQALGMRHQTASARIRELHQKGVVRDVGLRRKTGSGRPAVAWVPYSDPRPSAPPKVKPSKEDIGYLHASVYAAEQLLDVLERNWQSVPDFVRQDLRTHVTVLDAAVAVVRERFPQIPPK